MSEFRPGNVGRRWMYETSMLIIRDSQIQAMKEAIFVRWLKEHVTSFFPERCAHLGDKGVGEDIQYGIARAKSYGFSDEADICRYVDVMFAFHRDFDKDDSLPWASDILSNADLAQPNIRIELLTNAAVTHLDTEERTYDRSKGTA